MIQRRAFCSFATYGIQYDSHTTLSARKVCERTQPTPWILYRHCDRSFLPPPTCFLKVCLYISRNEIEKFLNTLVIYMSLPLSLFSAAWSISHALALYLSDNLLMRARCFLNLTMLKQPVTANFEWKGRDRIVSGVRCNVEEAVFCFAICCWRRACARTNARLMGYDIHGRALVSLKYAEEGLLMNVGKCELDLHFFNLDIDR